jgi:hypothetical protein
MISTIFPNLLANDKTIPRLTGREQYPVLCNSSFDITQDYANEIQKRFSGLQTLGNCIEKNVIALTKLTELHCLGINSMQDFQVMLGSFYVWSIDKRSSYGFEFNPPLEFHAWLQLESTIIDFALPGVILSGLIHEDHIGPALTGRSPVIFAGIPPRWLAYKPKIAISR